MVETLELAQRSFGLRPPPFPGLSLWPGWNVRAHHDPLPAPAHLYSYRLGVVPVIDQDQNGFPVYTTID